MRFFDKLSPYIIASMLIALFAVGPAQSQKISALPNASAMTGTEQIPCVQAGATDNCTGNQIRTLTQTFPSAALVGSPAAGQQEYDGNAFYAAPVASNRGVDIGINF